jgi:outer membrane lipoprotein
MKLYLFVIYLLLAACSNLPPAIEDPPLFDLSYNEAVQNIARYKEAPVRWGGTVIDVENEQNFSLIQVLYYPLNSYGRPQLDNPNGGRFVIKSPEFLDPAVYTKNSEITVAGRLKGDIERAVGKKYLRLPMISATVIHLWPAYAPSYYGYGSFGYGYPYGYPYYGYYGYYPFYRGGFFGPYW